MKAALRLLLAPYRFSVDRLFRMGEVGWAHWFDSPSLYGGSHPYLYQDSGGTTPVTAVGQTIGLSLDRAFGGYRGPELMPDGSFNGGTKTGWGFFDSSGGADTPSMGAVSGGALTVTGVGTPRASWLGAGPTFLPVVIDRFYEVTVDISGATSSPFLAVAAASDMTSVLQQEVVGGSNATRKARLIWKCTTTSPYFGIRSAAAGTFTIDNFSVREIPGTHLIQATSPARPTLSARVNLLLNTATMSTQNVTTIAASYKLSFTGTGTVTLSGTSTAGPLVGTGANDRVSLTFTPTAGTLTLTVSGSVTLADLRTADDAAKNIPAYQRVGATAADHDTEGFPHYALFDGSDDSWASTATVDGSAYDKVTVVAGVTKNSDAATGTLVNFVGHPASPTDGAFLIEAPPNSGLARFGAQTRGTSARVFVGSSPYIHPAPLSSVLTVACNHAAPVKEGQIYARVNSAEMPAAYDVPGPTGAGNYGTGLLSFGVNLVGGNRFNGREYASIGRFGSMSETERNRLESWVKNLMRMP